MKKSRELVNLASKENKGDNLQVESENLGENQTDSVGVIFDEHIRQGGYFRNLPNRRVLVPHKVSFGNVFGDESHLTVNYRQPSFHSLSQGSGGMQLADLNQNRHRLKEVESVQLLSSMLIRSVQIHRKHAPFIPAILSNGQDSSTNFANSLAVSQLHLHSSTHQFPMRLPPIQPARPSSAESNRNKDHLTRRATNLSLFPILFSAFFFLFILSTKQKFDTREILTFRKFEFIAQLTEKSISQQETSISATFCRETRRSLFLVFPGINIQKAQNLEEALSPLIRDGTTSVMAPANTPFGSRTLFQSPEPQNNVTHATLLENSSIDSFRFSVRNFSSLLVQFYDFTDAPNRTTR